MSVAIAVVAVMAVSHPAIVTGDIKKTSVGAMAEDFFGADVAISGDTLVVGASSVDPGGVMGAGAAFVFIRNGGNWNQVAVLTASDGVANDNFGSGVGVSGNTIAVGAPTLSGGNPGAVYVFEMPNAGWSDMTETAKLTASDGVNGDYLGYGVAIDDDTIVSGARNAGVMDVGAAYVFVRPAGGWINATETAKLTASDAGDDDLLGLRVDISGDTIVAGAPNHGNSGPGNTDGPGAAYVFERPPAGWSNITQTAKLTALDASSTDFFGYAVSIDGDTIVAGAANDGNSGGGTQDGSGSAYVFRRPAGGWIDATQDAKLVDSNPQPSAYFGVFVSVRNGRVVVCAYNKYHTPMSQDGSGAAYLFVEPVGGWTGVIGNSDELIASDSHLDGFFGYAVEVSEDWIAIGSPGSGGGMVDPGAAYLFAFDNDEDGAPNYIDNCPDDPDKLDPGPCGCGIPEIDSDGDGVFDCNDACPADAANDSDGDGVCDSADICPGGDDTIDSDGDGTPDGCDAAPVPAPLPEECCGGGMPALMPFMLLGWRRRRRRGLPRQSR